MTLKAKQKALENIAKTIEKCRVCKRGKIGKAVPGEGSAKADIVFIGEAPGRKESESGRPFIGPAGKLLREQIKLSGLKEEGVFITSPVKYLPEYVTPTENDIEHGRTHLDRQLEVINPQVIVLLGKVAALAVLKEKIEISKVHGTIEKRGKRKYFFMYHPAAALHNPNLRSVIKKDFKTLKRQLAK